METRQRIEECSLPKARPIHDSTRIASAVSALFLGNDTVKTTAKVEVSTWEIGLSVKFVPERLDSAVRRVVERIIVTEGFDYKVKTRVSGGGVERGLIELLERDAVSTRGGASEQWDQAHENAKKEQRDE